MHWGKFKYFSFACKNYFWGKRHEAIFQSNPFGS